MSEYAQAQAKWKKEIGFESLQFPVYKTSPDGDEFLRFDNMQEVVVLKTKVRRGIEKFTGLREALFVELCKWNKPCTAEEFNAAFEPLKAEINNIIIKN